MRHMPTASFEEKQYDFSDAVGIIIPPTPRLAAVPADPMSHLSMEALVDTVKKSALETAPSALHLQPDQVGEYFYQDGPPRGGPDSLPNVLLVLLQHVSVIAGGIVSFVELGRWLRKIVRQWNEARDEYGVPLFGQTGTQLGYTPQLIKQICLADAVERYGLEPQRAYARGFIRDVWFGSIRHPTSEMTSTIYVHDGSKVSYIYIVTGRGTVLEHLRLRPNYIEPLQTPDLILPPRPDDFHGQVNELPPIVGGPVRFD